MTTKFVGIKEFRANMASYSETCRKKNQRLIIMRKNQPLFELRPLDPKAASLEKLLRAVEEGREDVRMGRVMTTEQVIKKLGL